ncbi:hypothetical protein ACHQM5_024948 [Ranunculus cassubicifolius]
MVVCKCRKATKLYCFVHKVPVCGECICFPEHQICVIRTYSEWVIDGDYDWPPTCCQCQNVLQDGTGPPTTRLGCLHVIHTDCLVSHIKSYPQNTAPAGYVCPACSTSIWPPKSIKDSGSRLHAKLKESIIQTGLEKNVFGNHPVSLTSAESNGPPPAFASDPLVHISINTGSSNSIQDLATDIIEIDDPNSRGNQGGPDHGPNFMKTSSPTPPGATTRKNNYVVERQNSEISYYADDEDGNQKKYNRRGPFRHKFLRALLPFWSSAMPTLPVTAPSRKDDDVSENRQRHQRSSRTDLRKVLLIMAIMACMATMGILYYRLAQRGLGEMETNDEQR